MNISYKKFGQYIEEAQEAITEHSDGKFELRVILDSANIVLEVRIKNTSFCPYTWMSCRDVLDEKAMKLACDAAVRVSAGYKI